jgi:hypothetical protein
MNKMALLLICFCVVIGGGIVVLRSFGGGEDSWICEDGSWVKHGNPSSPMPLKSCENAKNKGIQEQNDASSVPPLTKVNFITLFFTLINNKEYDSAYQYLAANSGSEEEWIRQFAAMLAVKVRTIEKYSTEGENEIYKVTLDVTIDPASADAAIPYYGWGDNPNIRFIPIISEGGMWKIGGIGTGP